MKQGELSYDHRYWLLSRYVERQRKNTKLSLRSFARQLKISHSALSEILSQKRNISKKMAIRLSDKLGLTPEQKLLFIRSAMLSGILANLPRDEEINRISDQSYHRLDVEVFKTISDWHYYAILSLLEVQGFRPTSAGISQRLGITRKLASDSLKRLKKLGIIESVNGSCRQTKKSLSLYSQGYEPAVRNFIHQLLHKAAHSLDTDSAELRELSATIMAIDPKDIEKAREVVKRFRRELSEFLEKGNRKRAYCLSVQLFPVDQTELTQGD